MSKYKELYDLAREAVAQTEARFDAVDTKASNYLSVFTVLLGAAGFFFVKWVADSILPPDGLVEALLGALAVITVALVAGTWVQLLRVLKVYRIQALSFNDEMVDFFRSHRLVDVHFALSRTMAEVCRVNEAVSAAKLRKLTWAYRCMLVTLVMVLAFALLYVLHVWNIGAAGV